MASTIALMGYVLLLIIAAVVIVIHRAGFVLGGKKAPNDFSPDGLDTTAFGKRAARVHSNLYENVAVFCVPLLAALALGVADITNGLAYVMLAARAGQCIVHWLSTSIPMVLIRATLFIVQIAIAGYWAVMIILQATAAAS